ncbi:disease resistance protein Roq1-like [Telopea speciosissima]|uniref:disease resistance protein Roq1-like n=1 Tax=Telopea speciosissima TaxID=54955 RepID=UPI001CC3AA8A|nr:disease resistance protein Roq1-like [Telopea speciosissima]
MEQEVGYSNYKVFINFRGADTRNDFIGHLYRALDYQGIHTFIDSKGLWKGDKTTRLLDIIKGSKLKLSIAVSSQRYIESKWCLRELAQMLECQELGQQIIFPIFFKVDPSQVKKQTGFFQISPETQPDVYNRLSGDFSESCFLEDVRVQTSQPSDIVCLQKKLLYDVFPQRELNNSRQGSGLIKETLQHLKVLLIFDDVGNRDQLNGLAGDLDWFGHGSRIIIMTRDKSVLNGIPKTNRKIYEPPELNQEESLELLSLNAFSTNQPRDGFLKHSIDIVGTTVGLPLALEVLGRDLYIEDKEDEEVKEIWESKLRMLEQIHDDKVYNTF